MNRETLDNLLKEIKSRQTEYFNEINSISKNIFLDKKVKFKTTEIINNETKNNFHDGVIKDVTVTSDCDLMLEVKDINTKETKIIFSHNVLETEK
tara:strand:+ start:617 stop:901 length:285 start_codon:yes stop_codon:yes gene_type:complete